MSVQSDIISTAAKWITCPETFASPVICRSFALSSPAEGKITLSALGYFLLYINGQRVGKEYFLSSNSLYHRRDPEIWIYPLQYTFTYRSYYTTYDITEYLRDGDNTLEIALGDGWYRQTERTAEGNMAFGSRLGAIYTMSITDRNGSYILLSDGSEQCRTSADPEASCSTEKRTMPESSGTSPGHGRTYSFLICRTQS